MEGLAERSPGRCCPSRHEALLLTGLQYAPRARESRLRPPLSLPLPGGLTPVFCPIMSLSFPICAMGKKMTSLCEGCGGIGRQSPGEGAGLRGLLAPSLPSAAHRCQWTRNQLIQVSDLIALLRDQGHSAKPQSEQRQPGSRTAPVPSGQMLVLPLTGRAGPGEATACQG